ncbi:MAG: hypothetical protein QM496_00135 [Verrucomicrobiota bacterium]
MAVTVLEIAGQSFGDTVEDKNGMGALFGRKILIVLIDPACNVALFGLKSAGGQ